MSEGALSGQISSVAARPASWLHALPEPREVLVGCGVACVLVALVTVRAIVDPVAWDIGLAYAGGQVALSTGHPENLYSWIGTPFLAMVMATVSKFVTVGITAVVLNIVNGVSLAAIISAVWVSLRTALPRWLWWMTLLAATIFAPAISSLWWKQLNIISFALALLGWWLLQRGKQWTAAAALLFALSILIKPIVIVIPIALLFWRDTRRAAFLTAAWGVSLLVGAQAFLAWRAHSLSALSPIPALANFTGKGPPASTWVCVAENYSPASMLCRLGGRTSLPTLQRVAVLAGVIFLAWLAYRTVRNGPGRSWRVFAYACALSPMISPIAWSHYQILLAPLFVLIAIDLYVRGSSAPIWVALALAFVLVELVWQPYGTLPEFANLLLRGVSENTPDRRVAFAIGEFAQYIVLAAALVRFGASSPVDEHASANLIGSRAGREDGEAGASRPATRDAIPIRKSR